jgi:hypothetical protein
MPNRSVPLGASPQGLVILRRSRYRRSRPRRFVFVPRLRRTDSRKFVVDCPNSGVDGHKGIFRPTLLVAQRCFRDGGCFGVLRQARGKALDARESANGVFQALNVGHLILHSSTLFLARRLSLLT